MVSADSLNLDVLELIFTYLSGHDLASVASVSRSFLAGVIPTLYRTINFRLCHAKRYPSVRNSVLSYARETLKLGSESDFTLCCNLGETPLGYSRSRDWLVPL